MPGEKYDCSRCVTRTEAVVSHTISTPPPVLLLHLRKGVGGGGLAAIPDTLSLGRSCFDDSMWSRFHDSVLLRFNDSERLSRGRP